MAIEETRPWVCANGHVMGQVFRNGSSVRRLMLYGQAVSPHPSPLPMEEGDITVIAIVEGFVTAQCSICGDRKAWIPGEEALRKMLKRMGR
jgi:hypothetical protein